MGGFSLSVWLFSIAANQLIVLRAATVEIDVNVLADLYDQTNGGSWSYDSLSGQEWVFGPDANPCGDDWRGVSCDGDVATCATESSLCHVTRIDLPECNLNGELPSNLGDIDALYSVVFYGNKLVGRFPDSLYRLSNITGIDMSKNYLSGTISPDIKFATSLREYDMSDNCLSGALPVTIGDATNLREFGVTNSGLHGTIPSGFGNLKYLEMLTMGECGLVGSIPSSLGSLHSLRLLYLQNNSLAGTIPPEIFSLTSLQFLSLSTNSLTGFIPSFQKLTALRGIALSDNELSGSIPSDIREAADLVILDLTNNNLGRGVNDAARNIPIEIYSLAQLRYLFLGENRLRGGISESIASLSNLRELDIHRNSIGGPIPEGLYNLTFLHALYIDTAEITGSISSSIGKLRSLKQFSFEENKITSTLPSTLRELNSLVVFTGQKNSLRGSIENKFGSGNTALELLDLSENALTGKLHPEVFLLPKIKTVSLMGNCFTGTISKEICSSDSLELLLLDGLHAGTACQLYDHDFLNAFPTYLAKNMDGGIPGCLFGMANLTTLHLSGNGFYGSLDGSLLLKKSKLKTLTLSHNRLTGTIPAEIQQWHLDELDLQYNRLSGTLDKMTDVNQNMRLKLEYNRLSGYISESVITIRDAEILDGNRFQCKDISELPDSDPLREEYSCGSSELDSTVYTAAALVSSFGAIILAWALLIFINRRYDNIWPAGRRFADWLSDKFNYFKRCVSKIQRLERVEMHRGSEISMLSAASFHASSDNIPNLWLFVDTLVQMLWWEFYILCFIVVIFIPIYVGFKEGSSEYSTHTHQYWYVTCALYMKGVTPVAVLFCAWFMMLVAVTFLTYSRHSSIRDNPFYVKLRRAKKSIVGKIVLLTNRMVLLLILMMLVNLAVVFLANGLYVYTTLSEVDTTIKTLAEVSLAGFLLVWNATVVPKSIEWLTRKWTASFDDKIWLNIIVLIFNSICAPCLISAVTDIDCFQYAFVNSPVIQSRYSFYACEVYDLRNPENCLLEREIKSNTEFVSPFSYNYNCTSSLLYNFIPVYMYKFIYLAFIDPLVFMRVCSIQSNRVPNAIRAMLPGILWPKESDVTTPQRIFKPARILCQQLSYFAILLTFGVMCPPLAFLIVIACCVACVKWQILLGRYLISFENNDNRKVSIVGRSIDWLSVLDIRCNFIWRGPWMVHWAILWTSAIFFTLYFSDMAADEIGVPESLWVGLLPVYAALFIWFCWLGWRYTFPFISEVADGPILRSFSTTGEVLSSSINALVDAWNEDNDELGAEQEMTDVSCAVKGNG